MGREGRAIALDYAALVNETATTLRRLGTFLGVETPLSEQYAIQRFTGRRGDPSEKIRAGRIVQQRVESRDEIPSPELERATEAYRAYRIVIDPLI